MKHTFLLFLILVFGSWQLIGQEVTVTGTVTDAQQGTTLPGVNIVIKGTIKGTVTDLNGNYTIQATPNDVLQYSFVGYQSIDTLVGNQTVINVALKPTTAYLDEVVVVGYGQLLKSQVVGAVSKIQGDKITKDPVLTASQALQGKTAGVRVIASGKPGVQSQVRIRGVSSINGDANPLYVVDGVLTKDITNIKTEDIKSVEVLKDAASQAIYGSRAGNGVVIITTKSGTKGKMKVSFDSYVGFRNMTSKVKMADALTYAVYTNEARAYDGQPPLFATDTLRYNTDWFDAVTRKGLIDNYTLSISGGTDKVTYYFSGGFFTDNGIIKGDDYSRYAFRLANDFQPVDYIKLGYNLNLNVSKNNSKPNVFGAAYRMAPTAPVRYPDGTYGFLSALSVANPVAELNYTDNTINQQRLLGNAYIEIKPVDWVTLRSSYNFDRYHNNGTNYLPEFNIWSGQQNIESDLTKDVSKGYYWIFDNNVNIDKKFLQDHEVNVTLGYSTEENTSDWRNIHAIGVPDQPNLWYFTQGDKNSIEVYDGGDHFTREGVYSRLTYTFKNRYSLSGSLRRDGSSKFPVNQKWGTFYSLGATWIVTQENFMQSQNIFNELKLRGSYGKVGNDDVSSSLAVLQGVTILSNYYAFGGNSFDPVQAITFNQIKDAKASWEPTTGYDLGLEFLTLNRHLSGDVAVYNKLSNIYVNVSLPATVGDADGTVFSQAVDVRNKGAELSLNWSDKTSKTFSYYIGGNLTWNSNNVENVDGNLELEGGSLGNGEVVTKTVQGQPIASFWVYQVDGIYQSQEEIDNTPHFTGAMPGDFIYRDVNGDGELSALDRVFVGSYQPKFYYGINAGFTWKQIDFSVDCYGNAGNKVYNGKKGVRFGNDNIEESRATNRWTPDNPNASQPRASNEIPKPSTYFVESGDFFRINNVTLGYSFPVQSIGLSKLRVYVTAQNPLIFKKYSGFTPELPSSDVLNSGVELNIYPVSSAYLVGVNVSF